MQAYKLQGTIDQAGYLRVIDLPALPAGNVEVIVLHLENVPDIPSQPAGDVIGQPKTAVKTFQDLFQQTEAVPADFDPDQARWEALKEKHNL